MNASGIRDTTRVLHVSPTTVLKELKKAPALTQVHQTERMHDLVILASLSTGMSWGCPSDMHINSSETPSCDDLVSQQMMKTPPDFWGFQIWIHPRKWRWHQYLSSWQGQAVPLFSTPPAPPCPHPSSSLTMRIVPEPLAHDQTALIVIAKPTCGAGSQLTLAGPCGSSCWIGRANEPSTCSRAFAWYGTKGQAL